MRWIERIREHLHVTALEARALLIVSGVFAVGTVIHIASRNEGLHDHATASRIAKILDSLQAADAESPALTTVHEPTNGVLTSKSVQPAVPRSINLNTASTSELDALPGIGPATARAITEARSRNRFTSVDDLLDVKGIGEKKLERIRPYVVVP